MKYILYLASASASRRGMLMAARIPFQLTKHVANESLCSLQQALPDLVKQIAMLKMQHVQLPVGQEGQVAFVLTADTMTRDVNDAFYGKPVDRDHARQMLIACRQGATVGTAFCLEKKVFHEGSWQTLNQVVGYDEAWLVVNVTDPFIENYLDSIAFIHVSGAIAIEGFGEQFVKEIHGSYSAILGMPMFQLREALYDLSFYEE